MNTAKLKAAADLLLNATEISNQLRHLADNEIDSDSFAVVTENYNGREVEFERPITDLATDAARVIDELIAALEAKDAQIAELLEKQRLIDICQGQGLEHRIAAERRAEAAEKRVAELERQAIQPLPIGELINRLEEQTGEPWGEVYLAGINLRRGESNHG
ncbi:hypothetical protein ACMSX7_001203 [Cronobacter malonaticus]